MHFALATTQGGRPTTVTTAAMSTDSPRTSAVPAPTSYLPHALPSTSQIVGATSADASTGPNADDHTAGGSQFTMEDYNDTSSEDEYQKSRSTFTMALGHYFFERNLIETPNNYQASKPVIEYVNLKFVENNFRTLGLDEIFDKNNIMRAEMEFESFEVWFSHLKMYAADREYIRDLRLPLFCHLYLNLYAPRNHARLQAFLKTFKYLFASAGGTIYLEELRNVTDVLNLSPRLEYFRRNKFVYGVSPMFVNNLYDFFQMNFMLQVVFQEWIDINYITYENPRIVFDEHCTNNEEQVTNLDKANAPKVNNNVNSFRTKLCKKTLNSSQNKNNNSGSDYYNNQRPSTSNDFVGSSSGSSYQVSNSRKLANNRAVYQQKQDTNSELNKLTEYSEQSSTEDHYLEPRSRRSKKSTDNSEQSSTEDNYLEPRSRRSKKSTENSEQSSTEDHYLEQRSRRSKKSTENSEQSSTEDHYLKPRSRRSKKSTENSEQSSTEDHYLKPRSRRSKKSTENSEQSSTEDHYLKPRSRRSKKSTENSEQSSTEDHYLEQRSRRSKKSTENSEQSSTEDHYLKPRSRRSKKSTEYSEQSSTEDRYPEPRSRLSKKENIKRKHMRHDRDRPLSHERESRRLKKFCVEKNDDISLQKRSISHQENEKLSESLRAFSQSSSNQKEVKEERIKLRISRESNRFNVISSNEKKEPNDPENPILEKSNEEQISNEGKKSRKHQKKHKLRRQKKSTSDNNLHDSYNEVSNNDEKLRKKIKSSDRRKSTSNQNSRSCEKLSEISDDDYKEKQCKRQKKSNGSKSTNDDNNMQMSESISEVSDSEQKKYKRQKYSGRCRSTNYDNKTQMNESLSEVSDGEKKKYRQQKKSGKNKSISDDNMHISNDYEKKQKRQNKRSKTKSTSDDKNCMSEISSDEQTFQKPQKKKKLRGKVKSDQNIDDSSLCGSSSEDQESPNKDKENHMSNARRKYDLINSNTSLSESCSAGDSLEDSSSLYSSSCDEELSMRKYMRNIKKSTQHIRYETSRHLKPIKVTKINLKTLDEDLYLRLSRKIILKNCSKVSCSFLTSDQNLVIAGSVDALIYLWERDNEQSVSEESHDVLHTIGNINSSNFASSVQGNNLVEYFEKNKAFILRGHGGPIFDLAELPSAKILLSASDDKTYRAWDLRTKLCLEIYNEHEHRTWCIAASPYSLQVATGSCEGASCLWFLNYKRPLRMFMGHLDDILVLKFHPNQVFLATGSSDKTVRVFELTTGDCHRVLMGHTDYITCLEFNTENFNYLASAAGNGEIIVWDVPSGEIVWRIGVGKVLFSDLVWITKDVLLASLTTGVVLKCDTTLNYIDSSCKVNGFETPFYRLFSLQMINNIVYTIGIPDKSGGLKPPSKRTKEKALQMKSEQQKSQKEPSPLSKLFFPQHIIDNKGNSMTPLRGLSLSTPNPTYDFEYQINTNDQLNKSTFPNFLSMNLKSAPFHLSVDEISKLSSEYQSKNIRLIPASDITNNLQNAYLLPVQQNIRTSNANSINAHSKNVQLPSTSKSQKLNKTQAPPKSKITTAKQHNFGNSSLTMHTSIQHMQIKTTTAQEHSDDHKDTNMLVQQYLQTTSTSTHKQQTSNLLQVTRPGMSSPLLQNSIVQQDQKMQLQHGTGSNSNAVGTNVQQQQLLQQSRSNKNLTKGNVQQRLSPQTNNRSSNVTKRPSPRQNPNKSSSLDNTGKGKHTRMQ